MGELFMGRYASEGLIGEGSTGSVYRAHPIDDPSQHVVVKVMRQHVASDPKIKQLFDQEARSLARLRHPYIVELLDFSHDEAVGPCLVMKHIPGKTLQQLLVDEGHLSVGRAGLMLGHLCHALDAAHAMGIVHLDLKPANLMIVNAGTMDESLRVMDFGLSHFASKPHFSAELLAGVVRETTQGTPCYISPEQLRGDEVEGRCDLYSVGVMLFEMLTGQLPFEQMDVDSILHAHLHDKPPSFFKVGIHDIAPAVELVVKMCLAKYSVERPASARALAQRYSEAIGIDIWEASQPGSTPEDEPPPSELLSVVDGESSVIVHQLDAWMPERIAVVKLRGYIDEIGGKVVESEPGLLRIRLGEPDKLENAGRHRLYTPNKPRTLPVEIEMRMRKPDPQQNRLNVTVLFRPFSDPVLLHAPDWRNRCESLYKDLQSFLMAR